MARGINKLSARAISAISEPGSYVDGAGLRLQVSKGGSKSWQFRFMLNGRSREMGLGPVKDVSLAQARQKASECRTMLSEGIDPIEARKARKEALRAQQDTCKSFDECRNAFLKSHASAWKGTKSLTQWEGSLERYATPVIGKTPVDQIDTALIMRVLDPIWRSKTETATRVRGRVERILDWATVQGFRQGDNPARWTGHLSELLPAPSALRKVKHMTAMPYQEVSALVWDLRESESMGAKALNFLILTAARSAEVRLATWDEIDLDAKTWTIPAERMKAGREHVVPLSQEAMDILQALPKLAGNSYVFPGMRDGKPLSDMTLTKQLRDRKIPKATVHGFRSSFRDWAGEQTNYPRNVIEKCLAHQLEDKVEAAYHRSNLLEKRRPVMKAWAGYCSKANVDESMVIGIGLMKVQ
ncbi:phage integrase [Kordiimonas sediminis]|uniref:Phage integrase n=1 Tax=Kordiimonas sediminis TaxID=1735581 RepID=A0A919AKB0_9PROT|nr:integrase arm-type DNA-binding domain-containing protein [Kordiimonas sediminis]GHF12620.1 phage integrase [Kordiimonas sediminis]